MSKQKRMARNVGPRYRQQFLSGFESAVQPRNKDGDSEALQRQQDSYSPIKGARSYQVLIPVVIESVSDDSSKHVYKVRLNANRDIPISPYSSASKKTTGQAAYLPKAQGGKPYTFSMVYGVHKSGQRTLSHTAEHPLLDVSSHIYGFILEQIDRAIQCTILEPENKAGDDDSGQRKEGTPTQESLGANKKAGRGKKVLPKILPETLPEVTASLVGIDGEILGRGPGNIDPGHIIVGGDSYQRGELANLLEGNEPPDLGF